MKPRGKKNDANSTKQRKRKRVVTPLFLRRFLQGKRVVTSSDTLILMKRFCKFCYNYYQGNTGPLEDFSPFFDYANKYLKKKYPLAHLCITMKWLNKKYLALRENVENSNFRFKNKYEASIYKWSNVAWGNEHVDVIPMMIDLIKTPMKEENNTQPRKEKDVQEIGEKDAVPSLCASDSENEMKEENNTQRRKEKDVQEIGEKDDEPSLYASDSENEMKEENNTQRRKEKDVQEIGEKDDEPSLYASDSGNEMTEENNTQRRKEKDVHEIGEKDDEHKCGDECIQAFKSKLAKSLQEFQESYFRNLQ